MLFQLCKSKLTVVSCKALKTVSVISWNVQRH